MLAMRKLKRHLCQSCVVKTGIPLWNFLWLCDVDVKYRNPNRVETTLSRTAPYLVRRLTKEGLFVIGVNLFVSAVLVTVAITELL